MPQRHEDTKAHEDFFVNLGALVPSWQKGLLRRGIAAVAKAHRVRL